MPSVRVLPGGIASLTAVLVTVAACGVRPAPIQTTSDRQAAQSLIDLREAQRTGEPFADALADAYLAVAESEVGRGDFDDALHLAGKGLRALAGEPVPLDNHPAQSEIDDDQLRYMLSGLRHWRDLPGHGAERGLEAEELAQCQVTYDCWVSQVGEGPVSWFPEDWVCPWRCHALPVAEPPTPLFAMTFAPSGVQFDDYGREVVEEVVRLLDAKPEWVAVVVGHADAEGDADANMALSLRRAEAVRDALVEAGIESVRIQIEARGETDLAVATAGGEAHPANRRVLITLF